MIGALKRRFFGSDRHRLAYDKACAGILDTPPLNVKEAPLRFLSMMCHRDIIPYLVAIKSLYTRIGEGRVVIVDDGTLTAEDRTLLSAHLGGVEFLNEADVDTGPCPRGGTWERLLSIIDRLDENFVIQVDADTLAIDSVDDVVNCYRANRSFTLGTPKGRFPAPMREVSPLAQRWMENEGLDTLQLRAESIFEQLPNSDTRQYVRGSSGFAGFARGAVARDEAYVFSQEVEQFLGERWWGWGSEQVTSNYLVANAPDAAVLPQPRFSCFQPNIDWRDSAFLHFFGTYRYKDGIYQTLSAQEVQRLGR